MNIMTAKSLSLSRHESQEAPLCKCGCGQLNTTKKGYIYGHKKYGPDKLCLCGCREVVAPGKSYRSGHWRRGRPQSAEHIAKRIAPIIGRTYSAEHRKNLSISHIGLPSGMKGKHHTEEAKRKNSEANMGKIISADTRRKISKALKGRRHSEETKRKIGEGNTGNVHSKEARLKNAIAHMKPRTDGYCDVWSDSSFRDDTRGSACQSCGLTNMASIHITGVKLSLHHTNGKKNCIPDDIQTLCSRCHTIADWELRKDNIKN